MFHYTGWLIVNRDPKKYLMIEDPLCKWFFPRGPKHDAPHRWLTSLATTRTTQAIPMEGVSWTLVSRKIKWINRSKVATHQLARTNSIHDRGFLRPLPCSHIFRICQLATIASCNLRSMDAKYWRSSIIRCKCGLASRREHSCKGQWRGKCYI